MLLSNEKNNIKKRGKLWQNQFVIGDGKNIKRPENVLKSSRLAVTEYWQ